MILKRIKQCYQILFRGRDIDKELKDAERKIDDIAQKMSDHLELLVNSDKPKVMANANVPNMERFSIYEVKFKPAVQAFGLDSPAHLSQQMDEHVLELSRVGSSYRFQGRPDDLTHIMESVYERVAHEFAKTLINEKLIRVDIKRDPHDCDSFILRFEAEFYNIG